MAHAARPTSLVTAEEYLSHPAARGPGELVRGEVRVMAAASGAHGVVCGNLFFLLTAFVREHGLGQVFTDNVGFELPGIPDTVRSPDAAFVRADRLPEAGFGRGWVRLAPDLAVEVLSPDESASDFEEKRADYFAAGTTLMWAIDPRTRLVTVLSRDAPPRWLREGDTLDGGAVLPGFTCPVAALFERVAREP